MLKILSQNVISENADFPPDRVFTNLSLKNHFLFLKLFYSSDIFKHFLCLRYKGGVAGRRQIKKYKIDFYLLQLTI